MESLGAEEIFDYKDPDCGKKIREYTNDDLRLVFDCISEAGSPKLCEETISSKGGKITYLLPAQHSRSDVEGELISAYTAMGESFDKLGRHVAAKPDNFEYAKRYRNY